MRHYLFALLCLFCLPSLSTAEPQVGEFQDIHGSSLSMEEFKGKWVVVNYWATWCPPCLEELPELEMFHDTHKEDTAVVLAFNTEAHLSVAELASFAEQYMLSFPIIPHHDDNPSFGAVPGLPTTFLIDPQGEVVARQVGTVTAEMIEDFIARQR